MESKKYALITVSNRKGLAKFARKLKELDFEIIASKNTAKFLKNHRINSTDVKEITGYEPIMGKHGIKLIHPKIFGAILADPKIKSHRKDMKKHKINPFSLVVCNFYPFEKTISKNRFKHETAIYNLDIGGPAIVRCAAKNYKNVSIIVDPSDYQLVLDCLENFEEIPLKIRKYFSLKAFKYTSKYDAAIITYLEDAFAKDGDEEIRECKRCLNNTKNPTIRIGKDGLCNICALYLKNFDKNSLKKELAFLKTLIDPKKKYDAMVGISGGKDSTATLYTVKRMGFNPLAFTFDIGYYPEHIFSRAKQIAEKLNVDSVKIPIKKYIRKNDLLSYKKTAELFDKPDTEETKKEFFFHYLNGRNHYSAKCTHAVPFVRVCQLCRHTVIRAYYAEAVKRGINLIILGMNEWAGLSQKRSSKKYKISGIRKLQPFPDKPSVYVVHLPFLLQRKSKDVRKILKKLNWALPKGENFVESNSNSCLLARAAENKTKRMLGFHPDSTRLSREITVGFITKKQARKALQKINNCKYSVRQVLEKAGILN